MHQATYTQSAVEAETTEENKTEKNALRILKTRARGAPRL